MVRFRFSYILSSNKSSSLYSDLANDKMFNLRFCPILIDDK
jgi:hypothetical protein